MLCQGVGLPTSEFGGDPTTGGPVGPVPALSQAPEGLACHLQSHLGPARWYDLSLS